MYGAAKVVDHTEAFQSGNGHQYAEEEEDGRHLDIAQRLESRTPIVRRSLRLISLTIDCLKAELPVGNDLRDQRKDGQGEHHSDVGGEVGHRFEDRHKNDQSQTDVQHPRSSWVLLSIRFGCIECAAERLEKTGDPNRNDHAHQRRQDQVLHKLYCAHLLSDPQHGRGHIPNGRPGTTRIGRNDDQTGKPQSIFRGLDQFAQDGDQHNGGCKVVNDGRENKTQYGHDPQQTPFLVGSYELLDGGKTVEVVDDLNNGHGAHQEDQYLSGFPEVIEQRFFHQMAALLVAHLREDRSAIGSVHHMVMM